MNIKINNIVIQTNKKIVSNLDEKEINIIVDNILLSSPANQLTALVNIRNQYGQEIYKKVFDKLKNRNK